VFKHIKIKLKSPAVSTIEIILVIALFSVMVLGVSSTVIYVIKASSQSTYNIIASQLAEEGLEAVRDMKMDNNAILLNGTYGLSSVSGKWSFSGTSDNSDGFNRSIAISDDSSHTSSPNVISKKITSTITWNGGASSYSISTLLTNWQRYKSQVLGYWAFPKLNSALDIALGTYTMTKIVKVGNYIYGIRAVNGTNNLIVMDVSNPDSPLYVTQFSVNGTPSDIANSGNYLYISSSDNNREISVIDITTRTSPVFYSFFDATGSTDATSVYILGNRLYLSRAGNAATSEFQILNITNPAVITQVGTGTNGTYDISGNVALNRVYISGNFAYLATASSSQEIIVLDISNELLPVLYSSLNIPASTNAIYDIKYAGNNSLLIADIGTNVRVINISNPSILTITSSFNVGGRVYQIEFNSDYSRAHLATGLATNEVYILNTSNLASMTAFGGFNETGGVISYSVYYDISTDILYATTNISNKELGIYKPSYTNWRAPSIVSTLDIAGTTTMIKMTKVGNYIYGIRSVAATNNLIVIDVSNINVPVYVGQFSVNGTPVDIVSSGNYLYVATTDDTREVSVMDITTRTNPVYVGLFNATGTIDSKSLYISGQRLYLGRVGSATSEELTIINITLPTAPTQVGIYNTPANTTVSSIDKYGNYLYLANATTNTELLIVNVTTETLPVLASSLNLSGNTYLGNSIKTLAPGFLLIGDSGLNIYSVNVTNPASPTQLNTVSAGGVINRIAVTTDYTAALLATNYTTFDFEVMNTANLSQLGTTYGYNYNGNLNDLIYDSALDRVFAITTYASGELIIFKPNY